MGCDFPIKAYMSELVSDNGKRLLTFNPLKAINSTSPMEVPCNNCNGCKLERARQWSVRMLHESKQHAENCCITLTYSDDKLPVNYGLDLHHWQLFMRYLRRIVPQRLRFYACGEYGDLNLRPHYHAIIFGMDFPDKKLWTNKNGNPQYTSELLESVWKRGFATVGLVTPQSCSYVARYVLKKQLNKNFDAVRLSPVDGKYHTVRREFAVMSRRPGIGHSHFEEFRSDLYPSGFVVVDGQRQGVPRYYVNKLTEEEQTKHKRAARRKSLVYRPHTTIERRWARVAVRDDKIKSSIRSL